MARTILLALLRAAAVFVAVTLLTFALIYANGPGIVRAILGTDASEAAVATRVTELGLDRPLAVQYGDWLLGLLRGDLGTSLFTGQDVGAMVATRLPVTLSLVIISMLFTMLFSVLIGVLAAVYGGWLDRFLQMVAVVGSAIPPYIIAIVLVFAFAVFVPWFPATGFVPPTAGIGPWLNSITLPIIAILVGSSASGAAQFRGTVKDTLSRDYVRTLRSRGISEPTIVFRHVLRNAAGPGLIVLSLQTISLIGGVVILEQLFSLPGIGVLGAISAQQGDIPVVMGTVLVTVLVVLVVNAASDLVTAALNPKARIS